MRKLLAVTVTSVVTLWSTAAFATPIVYNVNRTIGGGSAVGTITTDGTLGTLTTANILDWTLTLTSANLTAGSPQVITMAGSYQTEVSGGFLSASASALFFGFAGYPLTGYFLLQGEGPNYSYWCVQARGCFDDFFGAEAIGFGTSGPLGNTAERVAYSTSEVIATTAAAVPEPGTLLLLGTGLAAVAARRRFMKRRP